MGGRGGPDVKNQGLYISISTRTFPQIVFTRKYSSLSFDPTRVHYGENTGELRMGVRINIILFRVTHLNLLILKVWATTHNNTPPHVKFLDLVRLINILPSC